MGATSAQIAVMVSNGLDARTHLFGAKEGCSCQRVVPLRGSH